jgi:hypothetical protein
MVGATAIDVGEECLSGVPIRIAGGRGAGSSGVGSGRFSTGETQKRRNIQLKMFRLCGNTQYAKYSLTYCNFGLVAKVCKILFLEFFAKYVCEMTSHSHFSGPQ